ncbi:MAG: hemerythrin domain-containing protein, partial [Bacteroidota bacterium]
MTNANLPTEPLRAEHRDLLPHLQGLDTIADEVDRWNADEAAHLLGEIVGFLRGHLVPHATAEEQVLYPAVEEAMAAPEATATMRADHVEIVARIDRLANTAATV